MAASSSTRRSWTAATRARARSPGCDDARADQPRAATDGTRPARLPVGRGRRRFRRGRGARAGRERLLRSCPSGGASSRKRWPRAAFDDPIKYGTVGAVAVDLDGHVAAATSTGGITAKRWGRVGDSPLIGAGTYADDRSAAVSATGSGEYFIRAVAAHQLAERVRLGGESLQQALDAVLADIEALGGKGGLIAVAPDGEAAWGFTTPAMYRGMADATGRTVAIYSEANGRAGRAEANRSRWRSPARSASTKSATASRKPRLGRKCALLVITGS